MTNNNETPINEEGWKRVAIFIDGSNLYHSLEENCNRFDLDFAAFTNKLIKDRVLFRTYYYNVLRDPDRNAQAYQDQQKFLRSLYTTPYLDVRLGTAKMRGDVAVEKGIDIMLATDLLRFAWDNLYDVAILVSGDGDFCYAVQATKDLGKHVEVAAFQSNLSWDLAQVADERLFFTPEYFDDLWAGRGKERGTMPPLRGGVLGVSGGARAPKATTPAAPRYLPTPKASAFPEYDTFPTSRNI